MREPFTDALRLPLARDQRALEEGLTTGPLTPAPWPRQRKCHVLTLTGERVKAVRQRALSLSAMDVSKYGLWSNG